MCHCLRCPWVRLWRPRNQSREWLAGNEEYLCKRTWHQSQHRRDHTNKANKRISPEAYETEVQGRKDDVAGDQERQEPGSGGGDEENIHQTRHDSSREGGGLAAATRTEEETPGIRRKTGRCKVDHMQKQGHQHSQDSACPTGRRKRPQVSNTQGLTQGLNDNWTIFGLNCMSLNADNLRNKLDELSTLTYIHNPDVIWSKNSCPRTVESLTTPPNTV